MTHPGEGRLQAYLDGELPDAEGAGVEGHLHGCGECRETLEELLWSAGVVGTALDRTAPSPPPLETAKARTLRGARAAGVGSLSPGRGAGSVPLARAAVVVLLLGAAASSALPGSPVREWILDRWGPAETPAAPERGSAASAGSGGGTAAGVRTAPTEEGVRVLLTGVEAGTDLRVRFVDGDRAGVFAPEGSRFSTGEGRLEAAVAPGPVRVELPRGADRAEVVVNGTSYVRVGDGRIELRGSAVDSSASGILLRVGSGER